MMMFADQPTDQPTYVQTDQPITEQPTTDQSITDRPTYAQPDEPKPTMTPEQFTRELSYQLARYLLKKRKDEFDDEEYMKWRRALIRICDPPLGKYYEPRDCDLREKVS